MSGDIHPNPGPKKRNTTKYPCGDCQCNVRDNQDAILCVECQRWFHARCINMSQETFKYYVENFNLPWTCSFCSLPKLNDSFFEQPSDGPGPSRIISQEAYGGDAGDLKSFLKNVVNCHTFKDFSFNVLAPQIVNKRSENFTYF